MSLMEQAALSTEFRATIKTPEQLQGLPAGYEVTYNSSGFRCDEFKTEHDLPHFLFVGCSVSFGDSVPLESSWAYKTHEYLKNTYGSSGFYNLSGLGAGIGDCVTNIIKYIDIYGIPDAIFFGVPDPNRIAVNIFDGLAVITRHSDMTKRESFLSVNEKFSVNPFLKISFDFYLMLDYFCKSKNIKLFASQVTQLGDKDSSNCFHQLSKNFDSFTICEEDDLLNFLRTTENGKNKDYLKAIDEMHPGTGSHIYWANMFIEKTKSEKLFDKYLVDKYTKDGDKDE